MRVLYNVEQENVDISSLIKMLEIEASAPVAVATNIMLEALSGAGGSYTTRLVIDGVRIIPDRPITVDAGLDAVALQGRTITLFAGQVLELYIQGVGGDTAATVRVGVCDLTPITSDELVAISNDIAEIVSAQVVEALAAHDIVVRPTRTILGPCQRDVVSVPRVIVRGA